MKKLLILAILLPLAGCDWFGSDDKKSPHVVVQPSDPVTPEDPPVEEEPVNETREEMIERVLNLPPEPDKDLNDSTVEGVDSNGNGIRDDIERFNAFTFYEEPAKLALVNKIANLERELALNINDIDKAREIIIDLGTYKSCTVIELSREERAKQYFKFREILSPLRQEQKSLLIRDKRYRIGDDFLPDDKVDQICAEFMTNHE